MDAIDVRARVMKIEMAPMDGQCESAIRLAADVLNVLAGSAKYPVRAEREAMAALAHGALIRWALV